MRTIAPSTMAQDGAKPTSGTENPIASDEEYTKLLETGQALQRPRTTFKLTYYSTYLVELWVSSVHHE